MPELHSLTPMLSVIQDKGFQVALVTDGRMSGASGKIPAAIHLYPEAVDGGALSKVSSGDYITIDAVAGTISADLDVVSYSTIRPSEDKQPMGFGRQLFSVLRTNSANAEMGGGINILAQSHTG